MGSFLRLRNKNEKALAFSFLAACLVGGVTEPGVYGLAVRYRKPFIGLMAGGLAGGLYAGLTGVTAYTLIPVANFACLISFVGGTTGNMINGFIACGIGFVVSAAVTYVLGIEGEAKKNDESLEESIA